MRIAVITDTHFDFKRGNKIFHEYFEKFYQDVFFPTLRDRRINSVIHMGDSFDNRKGVSYWALEWAQRVFYDELLKNKIEVHQICGNHDAFHKTTNKTNAIDTLLKNYANITCYSEVNECRIGNLNCLMVPWICKDNEKDSLQRIQNTKSKVVFGHLELNGFNLFPGKVQEFGHSPDIFKKFDRVFTGHYHTRSDNGKIFYLGNPYQMFWSDVNDTRGFHIFDTETYELEFIQNPYDIFHKTYYNGNDLHEYNFEEFEDKFIKLVVKEKSNQIHYNKLIDELMSVTHYGLSIIDDTMMNSLPTGSEVMDSEDTLTILTNYIDASEISLDKGIIKDIIFDVYQKAIEFELEV
jgi:predicted phosphodiesterase